MVTETFPVCHGERYRHCEHTFPFSPGLKQQLGTSGSGVESGEYSVRDGRARGAAHSRGSLPSVPQMFNGVGNYMLVAILGTGKQK